MGLAQTIKTHFRPRAQPQQAIEIKDDDPEFVEKVCSEFGLTKTLNGLMAQKFAMNVAINLIAGLISKCEFKTYQKGKSTKGPEYYLWNYEPNVNQNSTQFLQELIHRLCYKNEGLVFGYGNQLIIAEDFYKQEYALLETKFSNVTRKNFVFNKTFKMSDVLYFKLNNEDVRKMFDGLYSGYENLIAAAMERYKQGGGEKVIVHIASAAKSDKKNYEQRLDDLMENRFKKFFDSKNAVLPLHEGFSVDRQTTEQSKKAANEITDITNLLKDAFLRAAQAFKIPAAILNGDIADVDKVTDNLLTFCIDPLADLLGEEIVRKRYGFGEFSKGNFLRIDTTCIKHMDIFSIAKDLYNTIGSGTYSIDEIREKIGDEPLNTEFSQKHFFSKNFEDIENMEGGENDG